MAISASVDVPSCYRPAPMCIGCDSSMSPHAVTSPILASWLQIFFMHSDDAGSLLLTRAAGEQQGFIE
ncbi:MAG TPA: hypothetical protein VD932_05305 [Aquabacterium sp.]|nr:hypothetical protein [Aquabacterium sp.]